MRRCSGAGLRHWLRSGASEAALPDGARMSWPVLVAACGAAVRWMTPKTSIAHSRPGRHGGGSDCRRCRGNVPSVLFDSTCQRHTKAA
jgi:hypothetical protein